MKEKWDKIYIQAPQEEAIKIFYNRFDHNPHRVTCTCCGDDYSISEDESLKQLTGFHRQCRTLETPRGKDGRYKNDDNYGGIGGCYLEDDDEIPEGYTVSRRSMGDIRIVKGQSKRGYQTVEQYMENDNVLFIHAHEIKPEERDGDVPEQGFVWQD